MKMQWMQVYPQPNKLLITLILISRLILVHAQDLTYCTTNHLVAGILHCDLCTNVTYRIADTCCHNSIQNCGQCFADSYKCDICIHQGLCLTNLSTCAPCNQYLTYCQTCSNCSTCLACQSNQYAINSSSSHCQLCSDFLPNCTHCTSQTACFDCQINPGIILNFGKCLLCKDIIYKCLSCTSINTCTKCSYLYALNSIGISVLCSSCMDSMAYCKNCSSITNCTQCMLGFVVDYGCSPVSGCSQVTHTSSSSVCIRCNEPEFKKDPTNGICLCARGHLAGRYCTQIIGCISFIKSSIRNYCSFCNISLKFELKDQTCVCKQYYELKGEVCQDICGDGVIIDLPCDDGNLINGDGCSSSCQVEKGYICNGDSHQKSVCVYKGRMTLSLSCINNLGENTASIVFSVTPSISNFAKSNLTGLVVFKSNKNCSITNYSIINSDLYLYLKFQQDVQQKYVNVSLSYDDDYILSPKSIISFPLVQCKGNYLLYNVKYSENYKIIIRTTVKIISIFTWVVWLIGSFAHKMIGVETLQTIQIIFIMQAFAPRYSPVVAYFSEFNSVLNGFQRLLNNQLIDSSDMGNYRLAYSNSFLSNMSLAAFLLYSSIFIYFSISLLHHFWPKSKQLPKEHQRIELIQKVRRFRDFVYDLLIFPVTVGLFFNLVLSLMIRSQNRWTDALTAVVTVLSFSLVYCSQLKAFIMDEQQRKPLIDMKRRYVSVYLSSLFLLSVIVCLSVSGVSTNTIYVIAGAETLNSLVQLAYRPYKNFIHTFGIIVNQTGVLFNVGWILFQNTTYFLPSTDEFIAFALMGWLILIIICSFVRSVHQIRQIPKDRKVEVLTKDLKGENTNANIQKILKGDDQKMRQFLAKQKLLQQREMNNFGLKDNIKSINESLINVHIPKIYKEVKNRFHNHCIQDQL